MSYFPYLLLDADNTLFDFNAANHDAFSSVCSYCDIPYTEEYYNLYESINKPLWAAFDRGEVTKDFLVVERFRRFLDIVGVKRNPTDCNKLHLSKLGQSTTLLPYAYDVCRTLSQSHKLYIVTNAVASVQKRRLASSTIAPYISDAFISEEAGASKPSTEYFNYVFSQVSNLNKNNCILIGDSLSSDIKGANNFDIPCCWYNINGESRPRSLRIDYEINDLRQLIDIV